MSLESIVQRCRMAERISVAEALVLYNEAPLWLLSELSTERKMAVSGDMLFYNKNFHIEPTNICLFRCKFCSYKRNPEDSDSWNYSIDEMCDMARKYEGADSGVTEVHIVGGVHPHHSLEFFEELISRVKEILPSVTIKAFTAIELAYMIDKAGLTLEEGLSRLKAAGMGAIPGGGAEIFAEAVREKICPEKGRAEEWLAVHDAAHRLGLSTNATMLYGHVESVEDRFDHLDRLRRQQDLTGGFNAFIPLKYRSMHNEMSDIGEVSVVEDLRMMALSRLFLDNIAHIKAYWVMYGKATTEMALAFGADDVDGTIDDSTKIYSMAGAEDKRPKMSVEEIEAMALRAKFRAVERDTHYNIVEKREK